MIEYILFGLNILLIIIFVVVLKRNQDWWLNQLSDTTKLITKLKLEEYELNEKKMTEEKIKMIHQGTTLSYEEACDLIIKVPVHLRSYINLDNYHMIQTGAFNDK